MPEWRTLAKVSTLTAALRMRGVELPDSAPPKSADFDDENEATAVLDAERARALISRAPADIKAVASKELPKAVPPPVPSPKTRRPSPSDGGRLSNDEAGAGIDPDRQPALLAAEEEAVSQRPAPSSARGRRPGFDDEDEVTRVATAEAARELLRASASSDEDSTNEAPDQPTVVVADARNDETTPTAAPALHAQQKDRVKSTGKGRIHPVQLAIQNEPTRIVRVVAKPKAKVEKSHAPLWIALIVIVIASAAGGLLASRFVSPRSPASSSSQ
jgi:hypothetical protein